MQRHEGMGAPQGPGPAGEGEAPGAFEWTYTGRTPVQRTGDGRAVEQALLVLIARGLDGAVERQDGEYWLHVPLEQAQAARRELALYLEENRRRPRASVPEAYGAWGSVLAYVLLLIGAGWAQAERLGGVDWYLAGRLDAERVRAGESWLAWTALMLHADTVHLVSNLLFGGLFGLLLAQVVGGGLAWLGIALAGGLGNLANAWIRDGAHLSVGASTALFGALGLLGAVEWMRRKQEHQAWRRRLAPLVGAVALLALYGTGGERTDVPAHLFGFLSGLALGPGLRALQAVVPPRSTPAPGW